MGKETQLSFDSVVNFSKADGELSGFEILAYSGAVIERFWGKLVVSVAGISSKQQMPIFRDHDRGKIVGHSTEVFKDGSFRVKGVFSKSSQDAKEVMALAKENFPWQASIGVKPKTTVEIREGAMMVVNGQDVSGPAEVWLESEVFETSFVPLGADGNTSVAVFSDKADADQNFAPADEKLKEQWSRMNSKEKAEFADDYEIFAWYKKPIAGVVMRECSRIEQEDGNAISIESLTAEWMADSHLQAEFAGDFEIFCAYRQPMDGIRVKHLIK